VKEQEQRDQITKHFENNFFILKEVFLEMAAETAWPQVSLIGFSNFCQRIGLVDGLHLNLGDVDRMFIAARLVEGEKQKFQNMNRHMFFEAFCRVGMKRWYDMGKGEFSKPADAVQRAFEHLKQKWTNDNWEGWRWKYAYTVPVNNTLNANLLQLRQLYQSQLKPKRKFIDLSDATQLISSV